MIIIIDYNKYIRKQQEVFSRISVVFRVRFMMAGRLSTLLVLVAVLLCTTAIVSVQSAAVEEDLTGFPERPNVFRSPDELKEYLRALNEYFAIAGRPR